ncbi:MAG: hypothetical protein QOE31_3382 [Solirubrobacteraceae bacterium]|nr:hypothetical protein [Solirubrobacteraceae bacterium]
MPTRVDEPFEPHSGMVEDGRPRSILDYAARAVPEGNAAAHSVHIGQVGEMLVGSRWRRFTARETFTIASTAFTWRARFPLAAGIPLFRVIDRYADGSGSLTARVLGLFPVVRASGPATPAAEAARYLAELPWVPHALLGNPELRFREAADGAVEVFLPARNSITPRMRFDFDPTGDIVRVGGVRARSERGAMTWEPWGGTFAGYRIMGGVRIPTHAEVYWGTPEPPEPYWRCDVTALAARR